MVLKNRFMGQQWRSRHKEWTLEHGEMQAGGFLTTGSPEKSLNFTLTTRLHPPVKSEEAGVHLRLRIFGCSLPQR